MKYEKMHMNTTKLLQKSVFLYKTCDNVSLIYIEAAIRSGLVFEMPTQHQYSIPLLLQGD